MSEQLLFLGTFTLVILTVFLLIIHYYIEHNNFKYLHVSTVAIVLGSVVGFIVQETIDEEQLRDTMEFEVSLFFLLILPPIIFESAYSMKRGRFFANFGAITALAWGGCIFSSMFIGLAVWGLGAIGAVHKMGATECIIFGSLISATDPVSVIAVFTRLKVDRNLNAIVYGESVLNDAVAIVLVRTLEPYLGTATFGVKDFFSGVGMFFLIFGGSFVVGTFFALIAALIFKHTMLREHPVLEASVFFCFAYLPYMLAEAIGTSGIVSMLFAGIAMAHYVTNNLSDEAKLLCKEVFAVLATILEIFIFLYLGLSLTSVPHSFGIYLSIATVCLMLIARALHLVPIVFLINLTRKKDSETLPPIPRNHLMVLWFAGLRGAIAFALAFSLRDSMSSRDDYEAINSATLIVVMFTVIVFGNGVAPLLMKLNVKLNDVEEHVPKKKPKGEKLKGFYGIDKHYLKPLFTRADVLQRKREEAEREDDEGEAMQTLRAHDKSAAAADAGDSASRYRVESDAAIEDDVSVHSVDLTVN